MDHVHNHETDDRPGLRLRYLCVVCGEEIAGDDPHTDESSGGDCHEECCDTCHPELGETDPYVDSGDYCADW